jgi:hypothetical protein
MTDNNDPGEALGQRALATLARADGDRRASVATERALMDAFAAHHASRRNEWRSWTALAASIVIVVGLAAAWRTVRSDPGPQPVSTASQGEFVPWPGATALPAFESGQLVRTEFPASVLPLLGISQADVPAGGRVIADVLYAQDGRARAVRVVRMQP